MKTKNEDGQSVDNLGDKPVGPLRKTKKKTSAKDVLDLLRAVKKPRP